MPGAWYEDSRKRGLNLSRFGREASYRSDSQVPPRLSGLTSKKTRGRFRGLAERRRQRKNPPPNQRALPPLSPLGTPSATQASERSLGSAASGIAVRSRRRLLSLAERGMEKSTTNPAPGLLFRGPPGSDSRLASRLGSAASRAERSRGDCRRAQVNFERFLTGAQGGGKLAEKRVSGGPRAEVH